MLRQDAFSGVLAVEDKAESVARSQKYIRV